MTDPISHTPHLVVIREVNPDDGTNLHEFWRLESCYWHNGADTTDDPVVKCYVAPWSGTRDTGRDGLPPNGKRAGDSCSWSQTPEEVRQQFREEVNKLQAATASFQTET